MGREELTPRSWKELLEGVREEIGEGNIKGFGLTRRLEIPSKTGTGKLWLGGAPFDEDGLVTSTCFTFCARKRFPTDVRLGRHAEPIFRSKGWALLKTGDDSFDSEFGVWTSSLEKAGSLISGPVQRSLRRLADLHPEIRMYINRKEVTLELPGLVFKQAQLIAFVLKSVGCVHHLLGKVQS